ncbi:MAG TPA: ribonuclease PH [Polyangiales bacterium]|nr:ribonuclease PH [Polyangiales bacterium]
MQRTRLDGRGADTLREVSIETRVQRFPEGSVIYRAGNTRVLIAATVEEGVQEFLKGTGKGWITAEYAMHPRANPFRQRREGGRGGQISGRSQEIQRLIGRGLRAAIRPEKLGERTITLDCDVLDADGGTRTASITGGYVALVMALDGLRKRGLCGKGVLREPVAAISIGLFDGVPLLDLCYEEDRDAQVDLNLVATASGAIVEVQGTAEGEPMTRAEHDKLVAAGISGVARLAEIQERAIAACGIDTARLYA